MYIYSGHLERKATMGCAVKDLTIVGVVSFFLSLHYQTVVVIPAILTACIRF